MIKKLFALLLIAIVVVLGIAMTKPDHVEVVREARIKAKPEKIYPLIEDFHEWAKWSPWEKLDPAMKRTFGGPQKGVGATYEWEGNKDVGKGKMELTAAKPSSQIDVNLDFIEPFEGHDKVVFTLTPEGEETVVKWSMGGPANFMSKVMCVFVDMDKMVGGDFEKGLANLKAATE